MEGRPAFGHLAQPIFTARYSGIGHYHWPIGSQSLIKPQISNHHCVLSPEKPKIFAGSQASVSSPTWRCNERFLPSAVASNHQTIQPLSLSRASGLAFGQGPIWPKTNMVKDQYEQSQRPIWPNTDIADEAWSCYHVHGDLLSAPEPNIWLAISTGKGKTIVWFFSEEIEFSVWNKVLLIRVASL